MPSIRSQRQIYEGLLERYGRAVADAFMEAVASLRSAAEIGRLTAAIEAGQIEQALDILDIDPAAYDAMLDRIREAHTAGGQFGVDGMPKRYPDGSALIVRFDGRNPRAEEWLRTRSSRLVTRIVDDQRAAVRQRLVAGMERGQNPRGVALDIVGRINRVTGRREGGILGLSPPQEAYVRSARDELQSDDPEQLRHYLTRTRRDRRFDRAVTKAIREGGKVDPESAAKALTAYERRLLQLRGETIGRVEAMTSLQRGKWEAFRQAIDSGKVREADVRKAWRSASDFRVRDTHRALNGESAGFDQPFRSPSGAQMLHPMDTSLGAGMDEIANCRCDAEYRIDFLANLR